MKRFNKVFFLSLVMLFPGIVFCQTKISFATSDTPVVFAPGLISDGFENRDMTISPTNDELFLTIQHKAFSVIMHSQKEEIAGANRKLPRFPESTWIGKLLSARTGIPCFFTSDRPLSDTQNAAKDYDIWYVEKKNNAWGKPHHAGKTINTEKDEFFPSVAKNGNLYFTRDNDTTKEDIFVALFQNGGYQEPVPLPQTVNSTGYDFNAFIDPDETYIIFTSYKRKDDRGGGDLYISRKESGVWKPAKNLGAATNSTSVDYCPFVSFDKKHFFFTTRKNTMMLSHTRPLNAERVRKLLSNYGNGTDDIYIVDFAVISNL